MKIRIMSKGQTISVELCEPLNLGSFSLVKDQDPGANVRSWLPCQFASCKISFVSSHLGNHTDWSNLILVEIIETILWRAFTQCRVPSRSGCGMGPSHECSGVRVVCHEQSIAHFNKRLSCTPCPGSACSHSVAFRIGLQRIRFAHEMGCFRCSGNVLFLVGLHGCPSGHDHYIATLHVSSSLKHNFFVIGPPRVGIYTYMLYAQLIFVFINSFCSLMSFQCFCESRIWLGLWPSQYLSIQPPVFFPMVPSMPPTSLASMRVMALADVAHRTSSVPQISCASQKQIITSSREGPVLTNHLGPLAPTFAKGVSYITNIIKLQSHIDSQSTTAGR